MTSLLDNKYDIIIPVYNGLVFFTACYDNLRQYTPSGQQIIIVNDGSTEQDLKKYLCQIAKDQGTTIIDLPKNKGFVHAVNQGMTHSTNHVILLNSDTEVTPNWLKKIDTALFSSPDIGTVTPWTNKGTICSFPHFCEDNELPAGVSANKLSEICEHVCPTRYARLPTAVGFCMAIRREALDLIGPFDEQTFGRGYGEENDFCMRIIEHGFVNIHDDQTFIFHKGSMTFTGEKEQLAESHLKRVEAKHPNYISMVMDFIHNDPLAMGRSRINRLIEHQSGKSHLLYIVHNDPLDGFQHKPGGTEHHVMSLASALYKTGTVIPFILASSGKDLLFMEKNSEDGTWTKRYLSLQNTIGLTTTFDPFYKKCLFDILDIYHIDLVHIQHLSNSPLDISALFTDWPGGICLTLHEFFVICPNYNLLDKANKFCDIPPLAECNDCTKAKTGYNVDRQKTWQEIHTHNILFSDRTYTPSQNAQGYFKRVFGKAANNIIVREHGVKSTKRVIKPSHTINTRPCIAFLGGLSIAKGARIIMDLIKCDKQQECDWVLIGEISDKELNTISQVNVIKTGRYTQQDLPDLAKELSIDFVVLCSIWPETFSYTLSECWGMGLPVIVGPLGAPADRVKQHGGGWMVETLEASSFWKTIQTIRTSSTEYQQKLQQVHQISFITPQEMAEQYLTDYQEIILKKQLPEYRPNAKRDFWPNSFVQLAGEAKADNTYTENVLRESQQIKQQLDRVHSTLSWRITAPLRRIDGWLRRTKG